MKLIPIRNEENGSVVRFLFWCPGCKNMHPFSVADAPPYTNWAFNGDLEKPTFTPSLLCNSQDPASRCHLFVTGGKIQFLGDCWHALKGQTVDMVDVDEETWEPTKKEEIKL